MFQLKQGSKFTLPTFFFCVNPQHTRWCPSTLGRVIHFTELTNSNATPHPPETPSYTSRNKVLPANSILSMVKITHRINHHTIWPTIQSAWVKAYYFAKKNQKQISTSAEIGKCLLGKWYQFNLELSYSMKVSFILIVVFYSFSQ